MMHRPSGSGDRQEHREPHKLELNHGSHLNREEAHCTEWELGSALVCLVSWASAAVSAYSGVSAKFWVGDLQC